MKNVGNFLLILIFSSLLVTADTLESQISNGNDDIEEHLDTGEMEQGSSDLEMTLEHDKQLVGLRFQNIDIPKGAVVTNAYLQFTTDERDSEDTNLLIYGEFNSNAPAFTNTNGDISSRVKTSSYIRWQDVPEWLTLHENSEAQQSSDISSIIQEIIDQDGWVSGNPLALIITGEGKRVAKSYEGKASEASTLHIEFTPESSTATVESQILQGSDDIEEHFDTGEMEQGSSDLEMTLEHDKQLVGLRFQNITIPKGAVVTNAYLQFTTDEKDSEDTNLIIYGESNTNAPTFTNTNGDVSSRVKTSAWVDWSSVPTWSTIYEKGEDQQSSDISSIIQEIINQDGWVSGNPLALIITGEGKRVAISYEKNPEDAPMLHIEYSSEKGNVENKNKTSLKKVEIIKRNFQIPFRPERADMEAITYIPSDNAIWITNDDGKHFIYRLNLDSKEVDDYVIGFDRGFDPAIKAQDLEAVAYDELNDLLYVASSDNAIFRLSRSADGSFEIEAVHKVDKPLTSMVFVDDILYIAYDGRELKRYDFETNQFSDKLYSSAYELYDMAYSDGILWATTKQNRLEKINWESMQILKSFDMIENGVEDPRGVVVVDDKLYISDGADWVYGEFRHAMHVFEMP